MTAQAPNTWASYSQSYNPSRSLNYPSPFLDFEKVYLPSDIKELYDLALFMYMSDSNIHPTIWNLTIYTITSLIYENYEANNEQENSLLDLGLTSTKEKWKEILEDKLDIRTKNLALNLDLNIFGVAYAGFYVPFNRFLVCARCHTSHSLSYPTTKWSWDNMSFRLNCGTCGHKAKAKAVRDVPLPPKPSLDRMNIIRFNIHYMEIKPNTTTGKHRYFYTLPPTEIDRIIKGDRDYLTTLPESYLTAAVAKKMGRGSGQIELGGDEIFVFQNVSPSMKGLQTDRRPLPRMTASLRDMFFKNGLRRGQAMVVHEHTIPLRIVSPAVTTGQPAAMAPYTQLRDEIKEAHTQWLRNPNCLFVSPTAVNIQQMGGDKGALQLFAETQIVDSNIVRGYGVPPEWVQGGYTYSGGSISARQVENQLLNVAESNNRFVRWVIGKVRGATNISDIKVKYKAFKMADDTQHKQTIANLRGTKEVSHETLCNTFDLDSEDEVRKIAQESLKLIKAQTEAQAEIGTSMQKTQEYMQRKDPTMAANFNNPAAPEMTSQVTSQLQGMQPQQQQEAVQNLSQADPATGQAVASQMDMSPAALSQAMMKMQQTPPELQQMAMQDLVNNNPQFAQLLQLAMKQTPTALGGAGSKPQIKTEAPAPTQKPPRRAGSTG